MFAVSRMYRILWSHFWILGISIEFAKSAKFMWPLPQDQCTCWPGHIGQVSLPLIMSFSHSRLKLSICKIEQKNEASHCGFPCRLETSWRYQGNAWCSNGLLKREQDWRCCFSCSSWNMTSKNSLAYVKKFSPQHIRLAPSSVWLLPMQHLV